MVCLVRPELMVQVSDITTSPTALEPKLSGTRIRKDHPGCLAAVSMLIQADSPSGERLKPFTQMMKELDPVQFCVHFSSFIELGIWRVKNRPLPIGTGRLDAGEGLGEDLGTSRKEQDEKWLSRGMARVGGSEVCQPVVWTLHYLFWRALRATHVLSLPALAWFSPHSLLSPQLLSSAA